MTNYADNARPQNARPGGVANYAATASIFLAALTGLAGCEKKSQPASAGAQKITQPANIPATTPLPAISSTRQTAFNEEIDAVMTYIRSEVTKAKAEGKPVLIDLMEEHSTRDHLAKELALALRIKQEFGITDVILEMFKDNYDDVRQSRDEFAATFSRIRDLEKQVEKTGQSLNSSPQLIRQRAEIYSAVSDNLQSGNMEVVGEIAVANGLHVDHVLPPSPEKEAELPKTPQEILTIEGMAKAVPIVDKSWVGKLKQNPHSRMAVSGGFHGMILERELGDQYHVIPVNFLSPSQMSFGESMLVKQGRELEKNKDEIPGIDPARRELALRSSFMMDKERAFQANGLAGVSTICQAIDMAKASPGVHLIEPMNLSWRMFDTAWKEYSKGKSPP